jgi:preprotein translocase subunit SecA
VPKDQAIINEIKRRPRHGRPILVGTTSVEHSEMISKLLEARGHSPQRAERQDSPVGGAHRGPGRAQGAVTISTNMAGRGTDILLGGNAEGLAAERWKTRCSTGPC